MKQIEYKCDRCGAALGEDSAALEENRLVTQSKTTYKIQFLPKKREKYSPAITWDLCESCRESLDRWLEGEG